MPPKGWVSVQLPEELAELVDSVVKSRKYGYRSRNDFVIDAVRQQLRRLGVLP